MQPLDKPSGASVERPVRRTPSCRRRGHEIGSDRRRASAARHRNLRCRGARCVHPLAARRVARARRRPVLSPYADRPGAGRSAPQAQRALAGRRQTGRRRPGGRDRVFRRAGAQPDAGVVSARCRTGLARRVARVRLARRFDRRRRRGARPGAGSGPELARREFRMAPDRLAFRCRGDPDLCLDRAFRGDRRARSRPAVAPGDAGEPRPTGAAPRAHRRLGTRRPGTAARGEGPRWRACRARRLGKAHGAGAARSRTRAPGPDPARWRPPHPQPLGAARGAARLDRHPRGAARGAGRNPRPVAAGDRAHGADAAVFSPRRSPSRAVQQLGRGGWRRRRSRS